MKRIILITICLCVCGMVLNVEAGYAESKNEASAFLTKIGIEHYERGEFDVAVHELSKALMLDPENVQAKAMLNEMGIDHQLYRGAVTRDSQLIDLTRHVKKYQVEVAALKMEKKILENKLQQLLLERDTVTQLSVAKDLEKDLMQAKIDAAEIIYDNQREMQRKQIEVIEGHYLDRIHSLEDNVDYQSSLAMKEHLMYKERDLREKEHNLRGMNTQFISAVEKLIDYEVQLKEIDEKYYDLKQKITQRRAIDTDMLALLEENVDEQRMVIEDLKDKMVYDAIELGQNRAIIDHQMRTE